MKRGGFFLAVSLCLGALAVAGCGPTEGLETDPYEVHREEIGIPVPIDAGTITLDAGPGADAGAGADAGLGADAGTDAGTGADAGDGGSTQDAGVFDAGTPPEVCPAPTSTTAVLNDYDLTYYPWTDDPEAPVAIPPTESDFPSVEEALQSLGVDPRMLVNESGQTCFTILDDQGQEQVVCPDEDKLLLWDFDFAATQVKTGETDLKAPPGGMGPGDGGVGDGGVRGGDGGVGGGDGGTRPTDNCCLCTYQRVAACPTLDRDTCGKTKDCTWTDRGVCIGRFEEDCNNWSKQQAAAGWCTRMAIVAEPVTGNEFPKGVCKAFRLRRDGHSNYPSGCTAIQNAVKVCVNSQPTCTQFDVDYDGCWTFKDVAGAYGYMQRIVPTLGGDQCVNVSANQCLASEGCQTRYNFTITSTGVCHQKPGACKFGDFCHGGLSKTCYPDGDHGKVSMCSTESGIKAQTCCCSSVDANGVRSDCKFKEGRTCD